MFLSSLFVGYVNELVVFFELVDYWICKLSSLIVFELWEIHKRAGFPLYMGINFGYFIVGDDTAPQPHVPELVPGLDEQGQGLRPEAANANANEYPNANARGLRGGADIVK